MNFGGFNLGNLAQAGLKAAAPVVQQQIQKHVAQRESTTIDTLHI